MDEAHDARAASPNSEEDLDARNEASDEEPSTPVIAYSGAEPQTKVLLFSNTNSFLLDTEETSPSSTKTEIRSHHIRQKLHKRIDDMIFRG
jgi:hypothetical protein